MKSELITRLRSMLQADGNRYECVLSIAEVREIVAALERAETHIEQHANLIRELRAELDVALEGSELHTAVEAVIEKASKA